MNSEIKYGFDSCTDGKVFVYENAINEGYIKQESCDIEDEPGSIHNCVDIKPEIIKDPTLTGQETGRMTDCVNNKICVNEVRTSRGYVQEKPCDMQYNHGSIKDENIDDHTIAAQETKFITDYIDDGVRVCETLTSCGYIKQEPCDTTDKSGSIHNYASIKDEKIDDLKFIVLKETVIIEDPAVVQETDRIINIKGNYLTCCEGCGEEYDLYCLKCPMLIRILDSNNPKDNRVRRTLPKNFVDICKTPSGVGVVALRVIPKGVAFGPFEGVDSTKDDAVSKWKLKSNDLVNIKDPKRLNWMQYIRTADQSSNWNLTPFQYDDRLYYRTDRHISVGDELLVGWDSDRVENGIRDTGDSFWKPWVCERWDDTYACTFCCVGYKSECYLAAHNSRCPEKRSEKDVCKEIVQCAFCKIYVDEKEYSDYHVDRCCKGNRGIYIAVPHPPDDTNKPKLKEGYKCSMCNYSTPHKGLFRRHQQSHTDLRMYKCPVCPHRARIKCDLQKHVLRHANSRRSGFQCRLCGERFARAVLFTWHQKNEHSLSAYKCDKCVFETTNAKGIQRHLATHEYAKPYRCNACGKQFQSKDSLSLHLKVLHSEMRKKYKCQKCDFETIHQGSVKRHLLAAHGSIKRFKCPRCDFKTSYKKVLGRHLRYHKKAKLIDCESSNVKICGEVPAIARKTYSCSKCVYRTQYKSNMNKHFASMHDRSKIFACALCPYKTTTDTNLRRHVITHNDDWPFKCKACPQMFKRKQNLTKHALVNHSETAKGEYKCPQCPFQSDHQTSLKLHVNSHNTSELLQCSNCDFSTYHKGTFWRHRRWHESTEKGDEELFEEEEGSDSPDAGVTCAEGNLAMHIKQRFSNIFGRGAL